MPIVSFPTLIHYSMDIDTCIIIIVAHKDLKRFELHAVDIYSLIYIRFKHTSIIKQIFH